MRATHGQGASSQSAGTHKARMLAPPPGRRGCYWGHGSYWPPLAGAATRRSPGIWACEDTVRKWRCPYAKQRLAGLADAPIGPAAPVQRGTAGAGRRDRVRAAGHRDMPPSRWSSFELACEAIEAGIVVDISPATVAPWLATDAIKPWQYRSWSRPAPRLRQQSRRGPRPVRPGPARHTPARIRPRWSAGLPGRLGCAPRAGVRPLRAHHQISTPPPPDPSTGATPPPTSTPPSPACRPRTPLTIAGLQPGGGSRFSPELARGAAHTNRPDRCHARVA
jgi:hypothetical protein